MNHLTKKKLKDILMPKKKIKVLVSGAAGFIGSKICQKLLQKKYDVIGIDNFSTGKVKNIPKDIKFIKMDLSRNLLKKKIPKCDVIFHLAGQSSGEKSFDSPIKDLDMNTKTTLNLINYGLKNKCKKIIYASSMSVYGNSSNKQFNENSTLNPLSCYGVSKLCSEAYLKVFSNLLPYTIFRMFNVYGIGQDMGDLRQGMVSIYLSQALKNNKIIVKGSLKRKRDFIHIDDVVNIWVKSIKSKKINQIYNLGSGKNMEVSQLIKKIIKLTGDKKIIQMPGTKGDQYISITDNKKIKKDLKYKKFIDINEGLKKFYYNQA